MKRKVISIIGLVLFVCAIGFNLKMNSSNHLNNDVTLKNIKALTASAEETSEEFEAATCCEAVVTDVSCTSKCDDNTYSYAKPLTNCTCE